jgi:PAS domain S-box-containing protein
MAKEEELFRPFTVPGDASSSLDAVDLPIVLISRDCTITRINRSASTVLGLTAASAGSSIGNALARIKDLDGICARVIADGAPHRLEVRDGDRVFLVRIASISGNDRQIVGAALAFTNITAFRASIDQAIYEREYTKAILNTVIDPLVVLDTKLQVQTANRAFYALVGLSRNEIDGVSIRELGNSDWQTSEAWKSIEAILSGDVQFHTVEIDCEFPTTGSRTTVLNARRLTRDGNDLLLLALQDVTERKQAERATSLLAAIVGCSDDAIISKKLDGTITSWNKSAERLFGYTAEEAIGQHITLIVPWERRSEEEEILRRLARGQRVDHFETVRRRKDGSTLEVSLTISPIRDAEGKVIGASNVARDVTEQKRMERALRESEERFRAIVETTPECVKLLSAEGTLLHMNSPGLHMVGADSAKELVGKSVYDLIAPEDRDRFKAFNESICKGKQGSLEFEIVGLQGKRRHMETHAAPLRNPDGTIVHLAVSRDISERRRAEELLRGSEENYRKLAQTLDAQVRARTRELEQRNADVLRQAEQVTDLSRRLLHAQDEERRHIARELHDSAGQTLTVLGMSLAQLVQKTARSSPALATEAENIRELMQQLHREIRTTSYLLHPPMLDENGLSFALSWYIEGLRERSDVAISLSVSEEIGRLPGDMELAIFRVVQECLTNIHRHSGSKTASIRLARDSDAVVVEVQDAGRGISEQKLAELESGGSGVGIGGMRERVRQLGGSMKIDSDGSGTRISLTVPVAKTALQEKTDSIQSQRASV